MSQVTEQHYINFVSTFYKFLYDLNRYSPTECITKVLEVYKDIDMTKMIFRTHKLLKNIESQINTNDATIFDNELFILPSFDFSQCWLKLNTNQKKKMWMYLTMLLLQTDIFYSNEVAEPTPNPTPQEFNPYVGVGNSTNNYCVSDICASIPTIDEDEQSGSGGLGSIESVMKLMGLDKMINMQEITNKLNNMTDDDLDEATMNVKKAFGIEDNTPKAIFIENMVSDLTDEIKNNDGNMTLPNLIKTMGPIMQSSIDESGVDLKDLTQTAHHFIKTQGNNPQFNTGGINPMKMLEKLTSGNLSKEECEKDCNDMLKDMGMGDVDVSKMQNIGAADMFKMMSKMQQQNGGNNRNRTGVQTSRERMRNKLEEKNKQ